MRSSYVFDKVCALLLFLSSIQVVSAEGGYSSTQWGEGSSVSTPGNFQSLYGIIAAVIVIYILYKIVRWFIREYNVFMNLINTSEKNFYDIRVAMKKRLDLINQLRQATESYSIFERGTFEGVTAMRSAVDNANPEEINRIAAASESLVGRLFAVVENYPNLKTNTLVTDLMTSIQNVETEISQHRYNYNTITQQFNTLMDTIPDNFVGIIMRLKKMKYIDFEEDVTVVPGVASRKKMSPLSPE